MTNGTVMGAVGLDGPAAGDDQAAPPGDGVIRIRLSRPIQAHGEDVTEPRLRPMMPDDVSRVGYPFEITQSGALHPRAELISALISRLAGIPESSVARMALPDWQAALLEILGFFGESGPTA